MIRAKMTCIDFSGGLDFSLSKRRGKADVRRSHHFCSTHGPFPYSAISYLRPPLPGRFTDSTVHLSGPVSRHGLCPIDLSRKSARHRGMPESHAAQAFSHGYRPLRSSQHLGRGQREARLADICGHRPGIDQPSPESLRRRGLRPRVERRHPLRPGRQHHRTFASRSFPGRASARQKPP